MSLSGLIDIINYRCSCSYICSLSENKAILNQTKVMILVRIPLALLSNIVMEFNYVIGFVIAKKVKKDRL